MRERGATVLEVTIALAVITILLTAALGGVRAHQVSVAQQYRHLEASRAAASRLEEHRFETSALTIGSRTFEPLMEGATGRETVSEMKPGLYRIAAVVTHDASGVRASLTTLLAREVAR